MFSAGILRFFGLATTSEQGKGGERPSDWVVVHETLSDIEARIVTSRLQDEGIPARIRREAASRAFPVGVGILGRVDVMVPEPMEEKARLLLATFFDDPPSHGQIE
jgi:hypothetical protein